MASKKVAIRVNERQETGIYSGQIRWAVNFEEFFSLKASRQTRKIGPMYSHIWYYIGVIYPDQEICPFLVCRVAQSRIIGAKSELQGETVGVCSSYKRVDQPPYNSALRSMQMCLLVHINKWSTYE